MVYIALGVIPAKQRDDINQPIEFSLRVALNNGFEYSKQRLNGVRAYQKWQLSNCKRPMNPNVFFKPV